MVYRNLKVRIPEGAYAHRNGHVFVVTKPYPQNTRRVVGEVCGEGMMHPCTHYFQMFQNEWRQQYPDWPPMIHSDRLGVGGFALVLGAAAGMGIYDILIRAYEAEIANAVMDTVMGSLFSGRESFDTQLQFSVMPRSDTWYLNLFQSRMDEERNNWVRNRWIHICVNRGLTSVYGWVERHNSAASIWLLCADGDHRGLPLTYFVTEKSDFDGRTFGKVCAFLEKYGLHMKGVLGDKTCCSADFLQLIQDQKTDYVIRMKKSSPGFKTLMENCGEEIRENMTYVLEGGHRFGIVTRGKNLKGMDIKGNVVLIYDRMKGAKRRDSFVSGASRAADKWNADMESSIPEEYRKYVIVDQGTRQVRLDKGRMQRTMDAMGYCAYETSLDVDAETADEIYRISDAVNQTLSGFESAEFQNRTEVMNAYFCAFVAAIVRSEIQNASRRHGLKLQRVLRMASGPGYSCEKSGYEYKDALPRRLAAVFRDFGLNDQSIRSLDSLVEMRYGAEVGKEYTQKKRKIEREEG